MKCTNLSEEIKIEANESIGFPFEERANRRLMEAIREADDILDGKISAKSYDSYDQMVEDILSEES